MKFNEEQIKTLSQWEYNFHCAVHADWTPNPGSLALSTIHQIFCQVTGDQRRLNDNCQHCILELVRDCGRIYFADKAELEAKKARKVASTDKVADTTIKKVVVKTTAKKVAPNANKSVSKAKK